MHYLLSRHKNWKNSRLRFFNAGSLHNVDEAKLRMIALLRKFRINFSDVIEVPEINSCLSKDSIDHYLALPLDEGTNGSQLVTEALIADGSPSLHTGKRSISVGSE